MILLFFCDSIIIAIESLKALLRWFEMMSGLKRNYDKCKMIGIRTNTTSLNDMASVFGCKVGHLPLKYLVLPLCLGISRRKL